MLASGLRACSSESRVTRGRRAGDAAQDVELHPARAQKLPRAALPDGHPLIYVTCKEQLPDGRKSLVRLLFPNGIPAEAPAVDDAAPDSQGGSEAAAGSGSEAAAQALPQSATALAGEAQLKEELVVGFDVEWRPQLGGAAPKWGSGKEGPALPACVVQFSSAHATVVINLLALGTSMAQDGVGMWTAVRGAAAVIKDVFASEALVKAGLSCSEDLTRLEVLLPGFAQFNVSDCQVRHCPCPPGPPRLGPCVPGGVTASRLTCGARVQNVAKQVGFQSRGMQTLLAALCRQSVTKAEQTTDWQQLELTDRRAPTCVRVAGAAAWQARRLCWLRARSFLEGPFRRINLEILLAPQ